MAADQDLTAADMSPGEVETIQDLRGDRPLTQRLLELGFVPGARIRFIRSALGGSPIVLEVDGNSQYAIRREEAEGIIVT